jgi:hypothetical protein
VEALVLRDGGAHRPVEATVLRTRGATAAIALDTERATMIGESASARNAANGGAGISMRIVATIGAELFIGYRTQTISGSTDIRRSEKQGSSQ